MCLKIVDYNSTRNDTGVFTERVLFGKLKEIKIQYLQYVRKKYMNVQCSNNIKSKTKVEFSGQFIEINNYSSYLLNKRGIQVNGINGIYI